MVTLDRAGAGGAARRPAPAAPAHFAESRNADAQPLRDLDFRRGANGEGRIVVDLPNNQVGVDIRQQGQTWWSNS